MKKSLNLIMLRDNKVGGKLNEREFKGRSC
jgi:hypothetical protein